MDKIRMYLIKYAEIGIKGKNRYVFEDVLMKHIRNRLKRLGEFSVRKDYGRIYVEAPKEDYDQDAAIDVLTKVFGVTGVCPVTVGEKTSEALKEATVRHIAQQHSDRSFSFKVLVKRCDKSFPGNSMELAAELGGVLLDAFESEGLHVDVKNPDVLITAEIRDQVYVYSKVLPGPGGLPVGTNGKGMALLSGGIDSPVALYMTGKRGVEMEAVYFHSPPYTSLRALEKVETLGTIVSRYAGPVRLAVVDFTKIQLAIYDHCPHDELTIIMKRFMFRIAEKLAEMEECQALVTGESIGQVSSQTMQSLCVIDEAVDIPVFRPLIGMDKQEIVEYSERIETFQTSIQPFEDCCTIFVDKHPVTKPKLEVIQRHEKALEGIIEPLVEEAISGVTWKVLKEF